MMNIRRATVYALVRSCPPVGRRIAVAAAVLVVFAIGMGACSCNGSGTGAPQSSTPTGTPTIVPTGAIPAEGSIVFITLDKELALIDPADQSQRVIYDSADVTAFEWSPDGELIAVEASSGGGRKLVMLTPNGDVRFEFAGSGDPHWSLQGDRLIVMRGEEAVVIDTEGQEIRSIPAVAMPTWSPDGTEIAYLKVGSDGLAVPVIVNLESGEERPLASGIEPAEPIYPIAWQPAGAVIAYKDNLYEPATGTVQPLQGVPVGWSPDGRILIQTTDTDPATGATIGQLLDFSQNARVTIALEVRPTELDEPPWLFINRWIDWSSDSRFLVYLDPAPGRIRVRLYDTIEPVSQQVSPEIRGTEPDISPSGTHVAFFDGGNLWVFALDESALVKITDGTYPAWRP